MNEAGSSRADSDSIDQADSPQTQQTVAPADIAKVYSSLATKQRESVFLQYINTQLIRFQSYQLVFSVVMIVISAICISLVLSRPVENSYFLIDESGRLITQIEPLTDPLVTSQKVRTFADECVRRILNIDFVHYKAQLSNAETCFTRNGFVQFVGLMRDQGILAELSSGYSVGSVVPRKANFLRATSKSTRRPRWLVKGSYLWSLQQGKKTTQYPLTIVSNIVAVEINQNVHGMAIDGLTITKG